MEEDSHQNHKDELNGKRDHQQFTDCYQVRAEKTSWLLRCQRSHRAQA